MAWRIGQLAEASGCQIETIRYYERVGVLPSPAREANNYRVYGQHHYRRLIFVCRMRELGFPLAKVRTLLGMIDGGNYTCAEVQGLGEEHLAAVRSKLADLQRIETALVDLLGRCSGEATPDCSMLEELFDA